MGCCLPAMFTIRIPAGCCWIRAFLPLDKTAWMMIRLHALNNEGAVFPTYDELQLQLASPGCGKASRETVSRVLTMLRLTGWLSLCKRVRDEKRAGPGEYLRPCMMSH